MHRVRNGTVFKKQRPGPGRIILALSLQMCGDNGGSERDPTFQSFGVYGKKQMRCVNKIWHLLGR